MSERPDLAAIQQRQATRPRDRPAEYLTNRDPADERTWPVGPTPELLAEVAELRAQVDFLDRGIAGQGQILREVRAQVAALLPLARAAARLSLRAHRHHGGNPGLGADGWEALRALVKMFDALPAEVRAELEATDGV